MKISIEKSTYFDLNKGMFTSVCRDKFSLLLIDEGRLNDKCLQEDFRIQLFAYKAFETLKSQNITMRNLVVFHQNNKFLLQSKNDILYRQLGKIVGNHEAKTFEDILCEYEILYKTIIVKKSSIGKTRNVLEHMAGFVKSYLNSREKAILKVQIEDYANKILPVIVPLSTLMIYAQKHDVTYLLKQTFFNLYSKKSALHAEV